MRRSIGSVRYPWTYWYGSSTLRSSLNGGGIICAGDSVWSTSLIGSPPKPQAGTGRLTTGGRINEHTYHKADAGL